MPTYQYRCTECGESLEVKQSFSDAALTECPACQGALRKVFSSAGIVFKGSGFYRTDSRPKAESTSSGSGSSGSGSSGSGSSGSGSSAPATAGSSTSSSSD